MRDFSVLVENLLFVEVSKENTSKTKMEHLIRITNKRDVSAVETVVTLLASDLKQRH